MKIKLAHPAIVTGTKPDGTARQTLVRVETEFEFLEFDSSDATPAFRMKSFHTDGRDAHISRIGDRLYERAPLASPEGVGPHFVTGHDWRRPFRSMERLVEEERKERQLMRQEFVDGLTAPLTREEKRTRLTHTEKACLTAPMLRNWRWLSPDVDREVEAWRVKARELFANAVLVDGQPFTRAFEPCYLVQCPFPWPERTSAHHYRAEAHREHLLANGLAAMSGHTTPTVHLFAADDTAAADEFAAEHATGAGRRSVRPPFGIEVLDEVSVSRDFEDRDTGRFAQITLGVAESVLAYLAEIERRGGHPYSGEPDVMELADAAGSLTAQLLRWQAGERDEGELRTARDGVAERLAAPNWPMKEDHTNAAEQARSGCERHAARVDRMPITLADVERKPG